MNCGKCGKEIGTTGASFCPFCGAAIAPAPETPEEVLTWLEKADAQDDYHLKAKILNEAAQAIPDCFEIEWERLFIGHERPRKGAVDFSIIKCYLLHMYLTPGDFNTQRKAENRLELFEDPQLLRCLQLSADPEKALTDYLHRLSLDFIRIFLEGSNKYMGNFLGFTLSRNRARTLARPVASMLKAIDADGLLPADRREKLYACFRDAYAEYAAGETRWLDELLTK